MNRDMNMNEPRPNSNEAEAVENLQRYLRQLSFWEEGISAPPVDGIFESATEQALREFQKTRLLPETGRADLETWELLYEAYRASLANAAPPRAVDIFPRLPVNDRIGMNSRGFAVYAVQYMLQELEELYQPLENVRVDGIYNEETASAVRYFQTQNRIPATGEIDKLTWNLLTDQYNLIFEQSLFS